MITIRSFVKEGVQKIQDMAVISIVFFFVWLVFFERFYPLRVVSITGDFLQDLNLSWL